MNFFYSNASSPSTETIRRAVLSRSSGRIKLGDGSEAVVGSGISQSAFSGAYGMAASGLPGNPLDLGARPGNPVSTQSLSTSTTPNQSTDFSFGAVLDSVKKFAFGSLFGFIIVGFALWFLVRKYLR